MNEKRNSRFNSQNQLDDDKNNNIDDEFQLRESIFLSKSSSIQKNHKKKQSMQSLIIEQQLNFLNEDDEYTPKMIKRNDMMQNALYKTNPPSEIKYKLHEQYTPLHSQIGGMQEDDYLLNYTIQSQQDFNMRQSNIRTEVMSQLSYQDGMCCKNFMSLYTGSQFFGYNENIGLKNGFFSIDNQDQNSQIFRRNTIFHDQIQNRSSMQGGHLTRSPSHPNIEKLILQGQTDKQLFSKQMANQQNYTQIKNPFNQQFQHQIQQQQSQKSFITPLNLSDSKFHSIHQFQKNQSQQYYELNQQNLEQFNKEYQSNKDMLYAKIFLNNQGLDSKYNIVNSQSLFCFNSGCDQIEKDNKFIDNSLKTPQRKQKINDSQFLTPNDIQKHISSNTNNLNQIHPYNNCQNQQFDYYREFLQATQLFQNRKDMNQFKRRNSMKEESCQQNQIYNKSNLLLVEELNEDQDYKIEAFKKSKSRSKSRL